VNIEHWLNSIGLGQYLELFDENGIDSEIIHELTNDDLKDIGITRLGDRKKILLAISRLGEAQDSGESAEPKPQDNSPLQTAVETQPTASAEAENRQLSVMFCDLIGSTELSTKIDAEDLRDIINRFQLTCTQIAEAAGGFVARYSGDGILVYFGYPKAGEDDPVRAVTCGLQIASAIPAMNAGVRIGIATGRVIVGDLLGTGPAEERTVVGETPNLAARLQSLAGVNAVVVSDTTRQLVGGIFTYRDLGTHSLKGFATPVPAWQVEGQSDIDSRFEARAGTAQRALIGRESELRLLLDRWQAATEAEGQTVFVSGEAGIGKSHLIEALKQQTAPQSPIVIRYQCSPHHSSSALYPAIRQLQFAAGFAQTDDDDARYAKLSELLKQGNTETSQHDHQLFAQLLLIDTSGKFDPLELPADQIKAQTLEALISQLLSLSQRAPVLFLLEDAHWIDPTTLALVEATIQRITDSRVLLTVTHRPEWQPAYSGITTLQLNRLGKSKSAEIIRSIVGQFPANPMIEKIVERADGIPLFIEELTKSVVEHALASNINDIPETLQASLLARIDRLENSAKELAQTAASIGREFDRTLLLSATESSEQTIDDSLERLLRAELIVKTGPVSSGQYLFKHALVQEAVYDTMLRQTRQQRHNRIADALAKSTDKSAASVETLARHYQEAGRAEESVDCWQQAGLRYASQSANAEAVAQFEKGITLLQSAEESTARDSRLLELHIAMTGPLVTSQGFTSDTTLGHITRALDLAKRTGETRDIFPILYGRYISHCLGGRVDKACDFASDFTELANTENVPELQVLGHRIQGQALLLAGKTDDAMQSLLKAVSIEIPEQLTFPPFHFGQEIQTTPMVYLAWTYAYLGKIDTALEWAAKAISRARELAHPNTTGYVLIHNALVYGWLQLDDMLDATLQEWQALDEKEHVPVWRPFFLLVAHHRHCRRGEWQSVLTTLCDIRSNYNEKVRLKAFMNDVLARAAHASIRQGDFDAAGEFIEEGFSNVQQTGERFFEPDLFHQQALLLETNDGSAEDIEKAWLKALDCAHSTSAALLELRICTDFGSSLVKQNRASHAIERLKVALEKIDTSVDFPDLVDAQNLLESIESKA